MHNDNFKIYFIDRNQISKNKNQTIRKLRYWVAVLALADIIYTVLMIMVLFNGVMT